MLAIVYFVVAIICFLLGWLIKYRKHYELLSGYNLLTETEKDHIDHEALGNFSGGTLLILGIIFLLSAVLELLKLELSLSIIMVLTYPIIIYTFYRSNQFGLLKPLGKAKPFVVTLVLILMVLSILEFGPVFYSGSTGKVEVGNSGVLISGMFGTTINFNEIKEVRLDESIPLIKLKTFGYSLGEIRRGKFKLEKIGTGKLFLETNKGPYVYLATDESFIIINFRDETKTKELYEKIMSEQNAFFNKTSQ